MVPACASIDASVLSEAGGGELGAAAPKGAAVSNVRGACYVSRIKMARQLHMEFRGWGGMREGAGRKPKGPRAGVPHLPREEISRHHPVHVTWRFRGHVWNLRSRRAFAVLGPAIAAASGEGFRVVHYSVQGNHLHLVAEADSAGLMWSGVKGLGVRIARGLNGLMGKRGGVFADRYHAHVLRSPTEVRAALRYVLDNFRKHACERGEELPAGWRDPYATHRTLPATRPKTYLLRRAT